MAVNATRLTMPRKPFAVTVLFLGEGKELRDVPGMGRSGCRLGGGGGQPFTPRPVSWDLVFPLAPPIPRGWRGIPPTYGFPTEERMRLALFGLKTTQI